MAWSSALGIAVAATIIVFASSQSTVTDPSEVEALKALGSKLGLSPPWNFNVDPCSNSSGWSIERSTVFSPTRGVACTCNASNFCHVNKIAVVSQNVEGQMAPEIGVFSQLEDLNFQANRIAGSIPQQLGSLSNLKYLTVASNKLTGPIPKTIANLSSLLTLSIAVNNFSGSLPAEIGNLTLLRELYMDSTGLGGELPPQLANLQNLQIFQSFDNKLNGTIPDFLGSMQSLQELKIFGNRFQGPLPESLGNLSNLRTLEIGDVISGAVIPPSYYSRLQNLTKLTLRNCSLQGQMPDFKKLTKLEHLDLSYNTLTGQIPTFPSSLKNLFLGNNRLSGPLPQLPSGLLYLDVSYNNLTGTGYQGKANASIVGNSFNVNRTTSSTCLQHSSACNERQNARFAINCGGPATVVRGKVFDSDTVPLFTGTDASQNWVVTTTGFDDSFLMNPNVFQSIIGGLDQTVLYQSARTAPNSIRYLGVNMLKGTYTVTLHFAEIIIGLGSDGPGVGRRYFDVYIQQVLKVSDLDIRDAAGGSARARVFTYPNVSVNEGVLEIALLWTGKGTCCAPFKSYGPMISAIEVDPEFKVPGPSGKNTTRNLKIAFGVVVPSLVILAILAFLLERRRQQIRQENLLQEERVKLLRGRLTIFSYNDMKLATNNFASENKLGKGATATVYKGVLPGGRVVAIKQLLDLNQGIHDFINEATLISNVQHRNLVKLVGCCVEKNQRIIVFEYMENNSLYTALLRPRGEKIRFDWPTRFDICLGVARGIAYLHEESSPRIIHRDIKATNVLLDKSLKPKISDFGLAKLFEDHQSHISTRVAGTHGYLAPEYAMRGQLSEKVDVYSFGVLALEIVSGRPSLENGAEYFYLLDYAWQLHENGEIMDLIDPTAADLDIEQAMRVIQVAFRCCQPNANSRPTMTEVVSMLSGASQIPGSFHRGYFNTLDAKLPYGIGSHDDTTATSSSRTPYRFTTSAMDFTPR